MRIVSSAGSISTTSGVGPRFPLLCACFALGGFAALVYQTAWTRQFAARFGTSEISVAAVLAAFMAGLALGAWTSERLLRRVQDPLRWYAALELGIGVAALLWVPLALRLGEWLLQAGFGHLPDPPETSPGLLSAYYVLNAMVALLPPTLLMGMTLPLLVRDSVHEDAELGRRVGALYACNTLGAVAGALLGSLWLLPAAGLQKSLYVAAAVNLAAAELVMLLRQATQRVGEAGYSTGANVERAAATTVTAAPPLATASPATTAQATASPAPWILPLMFASGAVSFTHEVLWTRLLERVVGSNVQAFGIMVASFLTGIAVGGAAGALLAKTTARALRWFAWSQVAVALAALGGWYLLDGFADWPSTDAGRALFGFAVLLPLSLAIGVSYPLAVRAHAAQAADSGPSSARVYRWNTLGAIVGALGGGLWLIPAFRYEGALLCAVIGSLLIAAFSFWRGALLRWQRLLPLAVVSIALVVLLRPAAPAQLLRVSPLRPVSGALLYYGVGRSADVVATRDGSLMDLRTNGLPEAGLAVSGAVPVASIEAWMSALAVLQRPELKDMLVIGFGGGNVVSAVPPSVEHVDAIELEPEVLAANRALAARRAHDPLQDERLRVIVNDARGALLLTDRRYDAIVSQPSHPWTAGASHLYSREFLHLAHEHLRSGGVYVGWMSMEYLDADLLRSMFATLGAEFRELRLYRSWGNSLLFMASDAPLDVERRPAEIRRLIERSVRHYAGIGILAPEDLLAALAVDDAGARRFAGDAVPITDDDNRLAMARNWERHRGLDGEALSALLRDYDPLTAAGSFVHREAGGQFEFSYLWKRLVHISGGKSGAMQRLAGLTNVLGESEQGAYLRYLAAMRSGRPQDARALVDAGLRRWPGSELLHYLRIETSLGDLAVGRADAATETAAKQQARPVTTLLLAMQRAAREDWPGVAALDAALADADWTAPWAVPMAQLRVEWRMRVTNAALRPQLAREGIEICDRVLVVDPDASWYALRALSAVGSGQPAEQLESIDGFAHALEHGAADLGAAERLALTGRAHLLDAMLESLRQDPAVEAERWREVATALRAADDKLSYAQ